MVEADVVDCMIALPGQLFYSTQIPACLWFLARNKGNRQASATGAERCCSSMPASSATLVDRTRREFSDDDIAKIAAYLPRLARREGSRGVRGHAGLLQSGDDRGNHGHTTMF